MDKKDLFSGKTLLVLGSNVGSDEIVRYAHKKWGIHHSCGLLSARKIIRKKNSRRICDGKHG